MATQSAFEAFRDALLADDPESLYEKAPCGYLSTSPDGAIVKVNQTFLTWTGYSAVDLVGGRRLLDLLTPGGRMYFETHLSPLLNGAERASEIALELVVEGGGRMPVLVNAVLERGPTGAPRLVRYAFFDATQRRSYEKELLRAKQLAEAAEHRAVDLARTLQQTLIPPVPPCIPGLELATAFRPAGRGDEVGGDFYDVFQVADGDWVVALGDVSGKGVEAAVVTSLVRHSIRALAVVERSPRVLLHQLNTIVLESAADRFCTVVVLRLHAVGGDWEVTASAGGHPLPLVLRPDETPQPLGEPGTFVGAFEECSFGEATVALRAGESLFLHTDGVTEARRDSELFGEARLLAELAVPTTPERLVEHVLERVLDFQGQLPRDDIAILAMRVPGR